MADSPLSGLTVCLDPTRAQGIPERIVLATNFSVAVELLAVGEHSRFKDSSLATAWAYPLTDCCQADLTADGCSVCKRPMMAEKFFFVTIDEHAELTPALETIVSAQMDPLVATMAVGVLRQIILVLLEGPPWDRELPSMELIDALAHVQGWDHG